MKRPLLLSHWAQAAGFILVVWAISFLILYDRNLRLELASVRRLISRFEKEADFFRSLIEPTRVATKANMREVRSLEDRIVSISESLVRVRSDEREQIELAKQEHRENEQQLSRDYDQFTDDLHVCNDWTKALKKNQSTMIVMEKKQSLMMCLMEETGLKGDIAEARISLRHSENNSKNFQVLVKQWREKVRRKERELEEAEQKLKELKTQLQQEGCSMELFGE